MSPAREHAGRGAGEVQPYSPKTRRRSSDFSSRAVRIPGACRGHPHPLLVETRWPPPPPNPLCEVRRGREPGRSPSPPAASTGTSAGARRGEGAGAAAVEPQPAALRGTRQSSEPLRFAGRGFSSPCSPSSERGWGGRGVPASLPSTGHFAHTRRCFSRILSALRAAPSQLDAPQRFH